MAEILDSQLESKGAIIFRNLNSSIKTNEDFDRVVSSEEIDFLIVHS